MCWSHEFTSIHDSFKVISVRAGTKIFRSGFLGTVTQFTCALGYDVIKTLAFNVAITFPQAHTAEWCSRDLFEDVSPKHHPRDGIFGISTTFLYSRFNEKLLTQQIHSCDVDVLRNPHFEFDLVMSK